MHIVVDGDGSPVKEEVVALGAKFHLPVLIVTSVAHFTVKTYPDFVTMIYVERGADQADYEIVRQIQKGDVLITQDYGLAALALPKQARVFHHSGQEYLVETIDLLLEQRYFNAKIRKSGKRTKGPKPFTAADRAHFVETMTRVLAINV